MVNPSLISGQQEDSSETLLPLLNTEPSTLQNTEPSTPLGAIIKSEQDDDLLQFQHDPLMLAVAGSGIIAGDEIGTIDDGNNVMTTVRLRNHSDGPPPPTHLKLNPPHFSNLYRFSLFSSPG